MRGAELVSDKYCQLHILIMYLAFTIDSFYRYHEDWNRTQPTCTF
jgi:hypothetical protein